MNYSSFSSSIPIVFSSNKEYAPFLGVTLTSLVEHISIECFYDIYVLTKDIDDIIENNLRKIISPFQNISLKFIDMNGFLTQEAIKNFYTDSLDHIAEETYYRFYIQSILPNHYDKAIYLDCDLLILDDLTHLYNVDIGDNLVAAVKDYGALYWNQMNSFIRDQLKFDNSVDYFNAGVILLNLNKFREENIQNRLFKWLTLIKKPLCCDQDVFNVVCHGRVLFLSEKWNCKWHLDDYSSLLMNYMGVEEFHFFSTERKKPCILHFTTSEKPWNSNTRNLSIIFWQYARKSPYYEIIFSKYINTQIIDNNSFNQTIAVSEISNAIKYKRNLAKYRKYKFLSMITFGRRKNNYRTKSNNLKDKIIEARKFFNYYV